MRKRGWSFWLGSALVIGGAAVLCWSWWTLHEAATAQRRAKESLSWKTVAPSPAPRRVSRGDVIGELEIPLPLYNIYLAETDELMRVLTMDFSEWRHEPRRAVTFI